MDEALLRRILRTALLTSSEPLDDLSLLGLFGASDGVNETRIAQAMAWLAAEEPEAFSVVLVKGPSGWSYLARDELSPWLKRLHGKTAPRYSRAFMETLAIIAYRQPITRAEIEEIRGVAVSSGIVKTMQGRGWIKEVGKKETPGRPALFGTTPAFLADFNLMSLEELPDLKEFHSKEAYKEEARNDD